MDDAMAKLKTKRTGRPFISNTLSYLSSSLRMVPTSATESETASYDTATSDRPTTVKFDLSKNVYHKSKQKILSQEICDQVWFSDADIFRFHKACASEVKSNMEGMLMPMEIVYQECAKVTVHRATEIDPVCMEACLKVCESPARSHIFEYHSETERIRTNMRKTLLRIAKNLNVGDEFSNEVLASASRSLSEQSRHVALVMAQADAILAADTKEETSHSAPQAVRSEETTTTFTHKSFARCQIDANLFG